MNRWRELVNKGVIRQVNDPVPDVWQSMRDEMTGVAGEGYDEERHLEHWVRMVSEHTFNGEPAHDLPVMITHIRNCLRRGQYDRSAVEMWIHGLEQINAEVLSRSLSTSPTTSEEPSHGSQCYSYDPEIGWDREDRVWVACRNCTDVWYPKNPKWKNVRKAERKMRKSHGQ